MRLRNIPGAQEEIAQNKFCIHDAQQYKNNWNQFWGNSNPLHIEVGMGKGRFLMDLARLHPDINYIGIEKYSSVLLRGLQKMEIDPLDNVRFIRMDAEYICDYFGENDVDRIYLNFSDPWPKDRHARRRLTSHQFLERYDTFLAKNGRIEFKTDNDDLFQFSLDEANESKIWHIDAFTWDLHHDLVLSKDNVMTEYEKKFSDLGNSIHKMIISR
ncbi:tRNA (guanosine(46)-N7)-methyltransferase TrmB [Eubacterium oxidoreducens]|uniref:tRNA (guanine-N(7)-)-methyltransferase n=1 Tax=Eubacterium oxidoreducens TaxID=1732 RepID=A0A1G5ZZI8_EUBOX|nr:tRNA (guanosine(46)-N7)-methyltransferase TrmB [Eubacterium oxidoreducens]SDB01629.1 tRNA (guanine-N7-)-methyltransferase [Eubacterium oxidoreducens]